MNGYFGDSAITVPVGEINEQVQKLLEGDRRSRWNWRSTRCGPGTGCSISAARSSSTLSTNGFSIVREFVGHGIGTSLHEEPQVPNYVDRKNENPRLKEGMVLAIEPMVNAGKPESKVLSDRWTAVTDGRVVFGAF